MALQVGRAQHGQMFRAGCDAGTRGAAAWAAGAARPLDEAIADALHAADLAGIAAVAAAAPTQAVAAGLSARETEVLRLLAEGLSDREIAELRRRAERAEGELQKAKKVIEIQGNVSALLEEMLGTEGAHESTER